MRNEHIMTPSPLKICSFCFSLKRQPKASKESHPSALQQSVTIATLHTRHAWMCMELSTNPPAVFTQQSALKTRNSCRLSVFVSQVPLKQFPLCFPVGKCRCLRSGDEGCSTRKTLGHVCFELLNCTLGVVINSPCLGPLHVPLCDV